jgi:hypothetical protein
MSDPACRNFRELLGVYVVGAIEPNERSLLDAHLNQCYGCREELAGLAVLPALLHRIPMAEAEEIAHTGTASVDQEDPAPQVLSGLLTDVTSRRRTRRLRTVLAAAAAIIVAIGGSVAASTALDDSSHVSTTALEVVTAHDGPISGTVKYGKSPWGAAIWTRVSGLAPWTDCRFWVTTADGRTRLVGGWLAEPGVGPMWYQSRANVRPSSIIGFTLTVGGQVLLRFPGD